MNVISEETKVSDEYDSNKRTLYKCFCMCGNERWLPLKKAQIQKYCGLDCKFHPFNLGRITLVCNQCNTSFIRKKSLLNKSRYKNKSGLYFCSMPCLNLAWKIGGILNDRPGYVSRKKIRYINCINCNNLLNNSLNKYCNSKCQSDYQLQEYFKKWLNKEITGNNNGLSQSPSHYIKRYLIELYGNKCQICGWAESHPVTGNTPIQMDHIDGNSENTTLENLRLLCPNHHSLTLTYGSLNIGNGRKHRR